MKTQFSDLIEGTPPDSLLVGTLSSTDDQGVKSTSAIIEGTPDGFRMLAEFLRLMADTIDSGATQQAGWHLSLSPDDIPALRTHHVRSISLGCRPADEFDIAINNTQ